MLAGKHYFPDKASLDRLNTIVMVSLIGSGLVACIVGAAIYDIGRLFSFW